ncbi:MAG TPA: iron ABC transporter permease [Solirubrobacterales bacterium]|nr:iron ABC transporter permease [Solirubrobacterales bacterium]
MPAARRAPLGLLGLGALIGAAAVLPAAYLVVVIAGDLSAALEVAFSSRALETLLRTAALTAAVVAASLAIALPIGWLTVRTDLPGRRLWTVLCTLPLVIPSYVGAYLLVAALGPNGLLQEALGVNRLPSIYGFAGAWLVLTLFTYPLALIPLRATLRRIDPQLEDAARAMGRSPLEVFRTVVLPQLWPVLAAASLLVALFTISDFGAVSILRFQSFTAEIYVAYQSSFDRVAAAALGAVLVVAMLVLLLASSRVRGARAVHRLGPGTLRPTQPYRLGRWKWPALIFCSLIVLVAFVLPVGVLIYWASKGISTGSTSLNTIAALGGNSLLIAVWAAVVGAVAALVVAALAVRYPSRTTRLVERLAHGGYALPGILVALGLVFFATRAVPALYQTIGLLVFAITIHYLPLAIGPIGSSLVQLSPRIEEAARGMGRGPTEVFRTITIPLARGGMMAGAALVFLHAMKELTVTLILSPIGFKTLATDIWTQTTYGFYEASAIPALVLLAVAAIPVYLLSEQGAAPS